MSQRAPECEHLTVEEHDGLAVVMINRPQAFNTLSVETLVEMIRTFEWLGRRPDLGAVVLGSNGGNVFAAGADIGELSALNGLTALSFAHRGQRLCQLIETGQQAVIAAIDGYCLGGGLDLALACHLRYATSQSIFAHPGARIGIMTGFGGTQRLPRLIGKSRALELFLTGKQITAAEAQACGFIHRVVNDRPILQAAQETARKNISPPDERKPQTIPHDNRF